MINPKLLERYRAHRASGHTAKLALYYARQPEPVPLEWRNDLARWEIDGFSIAAKIDLDDYADSSYLGAYSTNWQPGAVADGDTLKSSGRYFYLDGGKFGAESVKPSRWFVPAHSEESTYADLRALKYGRRLARDLARAYVHQDKRRIDRLASYDWYFIGIVVTAYQYGVKLGQASLWGIESDSGQDYIDSTAYDLAAEALAEARDKLSEIRNAA